MAKKIRVNSLLSDIRNMDISDCSEASLQPISQRSCADPNSAGRPQQKGPGRWLHERD